MIRVLVGLLAFVSCGVAQAAPLVYFTLEGRRQGSNDAFANSVEIALGDLVEYRLQMSMAPPGTQNQHLGQNGFSPAYRHGVNSLSISMFQDPADAIQADFGAPVVLTPDGDRLRGHGWNAGVGADGGRPTLRPSTQWRDIPEIRPIQGAGVFTGEDQQTIYSGTLSIATIAGDIGSILAEVGP